VPRNRAEWVGCLSMVAPQAVRAPQTRRKRHGVGAPCKSNNRRASRSVRGRGHGRGSAKAKTDRILLDAEVGASGELPPLVKQSFNEGCYAPSTGMEMDEWQILLDQFIAMGVLVLDQFIAMGVLVKDEVTIIDSG
jgi:hypothetical protein